MEFFDKSIAALRGGTEQGARAITLLTRYAPADVTAQTGAAWEAWLRENRPYLFFSDAGDYRWYVDPLAKKRGIPSKQLRGPARATDRART